MISRRLLITIVVLLLAVVGMGLYGFHLRNQALQLQATAAMDVRPAAPPIEGRKQQIALILPNDSTGKLYRRDLSTTLPTEPSLRAREVVHTLVTVLQEETSLHPIGAGADVKTVFLLNDGRTAVVDMNAEFADQHRSGILVEDLTIAAIAKTLAANLPEIKQIKVLVDGKERETLAGHADLTDFYSTDTQWPTE